MKKNAVFTMVKNEKWFLPIWLNYYSKFFEEKDIYVLDHASTDDSIQLVKEQYKKINIVKLTYEPFDDIFKINEIKKFQSALLGQYNYTIFSDPDELLWTDNGLDNYIKRLKEDFVRCDGWEIIHKIKEELALDISKPILLQRKYWTHRPFWLGKILISRIPLNWLPGLHVIPGKEQHPVDFNLKLIHLHRMDYELSYIKNISNSMMKRPPGLDLGAANFLTEFKAFNAHFWDGVKDEIVVDIPKNITDSKLF